MTQRQYVLPCDAYAADGSVAVCSSNAAGWPDVGSKARDAAELSSPAELSNPSKVLGSNVASCGSSGNVREMSPSGGLDHSGSGVETSRVSSSSRMSGRAKSVWHAASRG